MCCSVSSNSPLPRRPPRCPSTTVHGPMPCHRGPATPHTDWLPALLPSLPSCRASSAPCRARGPHVHAPCGWRISVHSNVLLALAYLTRVPLPAVTLLELSGGVGVQGPVCKPPASTPLPSTAPGIGSVLLYCSPRPSSAVSTSLLKSLAEFSVLRVMGSLKELFNLLSSSLFNLL